MVPGDATVAVGFGLPVNVADLAGTQALGRVHDVFRAANGDTCAQARGSFGAERRMQEDGAGDTWQGVDRSAAMPLDQLDRLARIEAPLHHERATMGKRRAHRIGRAEGPEQWRGHEYTIAGLQSLALADVEAVLDRRAVTQRNGLRVGARPRGVKDECNVVRPRAISRGQRLERLMRFE